MKLTDMALIFVVILLPVVIIVFVNTSFVLKSEKQELYYKEIIESAVEDAVIAMKRVENEDKNIDYGYSSIIDNKVSINADIAISAFENSLYNTFNIKGNAASEKNLKTYIPVIAVFDYDGVYIHSAEISEDGVSYEFITKPKRYYNYTYVLVDNSTLEEHEYSFKPYNELQENDIILGPYIYEVNFTMDNYITLYVSKILNENNTYVYKKDGNFILKQHSKVSFYLDDNKNIGNLAIYESYMLSDKIGVLRSNIKKELQSKRKETIAKICMQELAYAANAHNKYAQMAGIKYNFKFTVDSDEAFYETVDSIGMFALVQGISLGNRYLNYKAYGISDLSLVKKYYLTEPLNPKDYPEIPGYYYQKLYHKSDKCEAYLNLKSMGYSNINYKHFHSPKEAATNGYYSCPVCKP